MARPVPGVTAPAPDALAEHDTGAERDTTAERDAPAEPDASAERDAPAGQSRRHAHRWQHAAVLASYLVIALALLNNLWRHLPHGRLVIGGIDQYMIEWYLWHGAYAVIHGANPFFTTLWNPPTGANVIANTSVLGLGVPLAPLTLLFGPQVTLVVALTLGMAGSGAAWYWFFRRVVPGSTLGAALGGGFCAFGPPLVSHANGAHLNLAVTALAPFIIANVLRLREPGRALRNGVPLGLLIAYQIFIGEELVLLTALGLALFCLAYAALRPRPALAALPHLAKGLAVAVAVALPLLAYPLWWQFAGPQSYSGIQNASSTTNDIVSMGLLPSQSFIGDQASTGPYVRYHSEENAFFGVPLLILLTFGVWRLRRELLARLSAIMILLASLLSLGGVMHLAGHRLIPGPWALVQRLPILDSMIVSRLTFLAIPFIGLMLALMMARGGAAAADGDSIGRPAAEAVRVRRFVLLAIVAALVSVAPAPLPISDRPAIPTFITSGEWQRTIGPGSTIMTVPMTMSNGGLDTVNWQVSADGQFSLVGGYFVGPHGTDRSGHSFPVNTATQRMINDLWLTGKAPKITEPQRAQARVDLTALHVDAIVVADRGHTKEVVLALTQLLGVPPAHLTDVWTWRIRDGVAVTSTN
jgi:hypothetical protein